MKIRNDNRGDHSAQSPDFSYHLFFYFPSGLETDLTDHIKLGDPTC